MPATPARFATTLGYVLTALPGLKDDPRRSVIEYARNNLGILLDKVTCPTGANIVLNVDISCLDKEKDSALIVPEDYLEKEHVVAQEVRWGILLMTPDPSREMWTPGSIVIYQPYGNTEISDGIFSVSDQNIILAMWPK